MILTIIKEGLSASKAAIHWYKNRKTKIKKEENFDAKYKTKSYMDKYNTDN